MSAEVINDEHRAKWAAAVAEYGSAIRVPFEVAEQINEETRQAFLAELAAPRADATPAQPRQERPTSGRCEHCGEKTGGGRFVVGHDAKLKSELAQNLKGWLGGHYQGSVEPLVADAAELYARNWMRTSLETRFPTEFVVQAQDLAARPGFVEGRTAARLESKGAQS